MKTSSSIRYLTGKIPWWISGLSGHGFKFASVLGEIVAQFANNLPISFNLKPFRFPASSNVKNLTVVYILPTVFLFSVAMC
jgi:hypothetical protein